MLVTVSFNINDEQKIMDIMLIPQRRYDMFCSGTLESVASNCGVSCSKCQERLNSSKPETREDLLLIYALDSKAATMELLCNLAETGVTRVQTTPSLASFFESRQLLCTKCSEPEDFTANQKPSTSKVVKKEPLLCIKRIKLEEPQVVESVESNSLQVDNSYESDAEEEFLTICDEPLDDTAPGISNALQEDVFPILSAAVHLQPAVPGKPETRGGRSFVENQERSQIEQLMTPGSGNETNDENIAAKEVLEFSTPANKDRLILTANSEGTQIGKEQCQVCKKTLNVSSGRDYNTNMTFSMQSHSRVHLETLPYTCRVCGYECRFGSLMKNHCRRRHASAKPSYKDNTGDLGYIEELKTMTKQCFPEWKPVSRRESLGKASKRPHD